MLRVIVEVNLMSDVEALIGSGSIKRNGSCCKLNVDVSLVNTGPSRVGSVIRNEIE